MWVAGAAMFLFFDRLSKDPEGAVGWYGRVGWAIAILSIPISSYLLGFDRDQWMWGTGSTVVGVLIASLVLYARPLRRS